jgi:hypothetical protein
MAKPRQAGSSGPPLISRQNTNSGRNVATRSPTRPKSSSSPTSANSALATTASASGKPMASAYQRRGTRQRMMSRSQPRTEPPVTRVTTAAAAAGAKTPTKNGRAAALSSPAIMAGVISVHDMANAKTKNPAVG